jgi:segregation and condensation protein B
MTLELKHIVEAILFSAERPLATKDIRQIFAEATNEEGGPAVTEGFRNVREAQLAAALEELKIEYDTQQRAFQLVEVAGGWRLVSRPEYAPWLKQLLDEARPHRLSAPALETLAIIALRQPISRADVAAIRGVEVDGVVKTLLERDLITITGRSDEPGRPMLYGTTQKFLEHFGLRSLDDMPRAAELRLQAAALQAAEAKQEKVSSPPGGEDKGEGAAAQQPATTTPHPNPLPHGERGAMTHEGQAPTTAETN